MKKTHHLKLVVFYVTSTVRSFRDGNPILLSLVKDVKLGIYIVPTRNRTQGLIIDKKPWIYIIRFAILLGPSNLNNLATKVQSQQN